MRVFCYFMEPASYTLDLVRNIHSRLGINIAFIEDETKAKGSFEGLDNIMFLSRISLFSRVRYIYSMWKENDLIIINGYMNYVFCLNFFFNIFSSKRKYIAIESDTQLRHLDSVLKHLIKYFYLSIIFKNKFVLGFAGGSNTHKELFRHYGMEDSKIFMMPMVIDNKRYYNDLARESNVFSFLYVGRLISTKNVGILCQKFIDLFGDKNVKLVIAGGGNNLSRLQARYEHRNIEFKGSVFGEDLIKLYHNASVFVFPSSVEAWGLVINEAMSAGLPIITHRNVGSVYDLVDGMNTGFVIKDFSELGLRMLDLYNNPDLCDKFSKNAVLLMKEYWNYELYNKCLTSAIRKIERWS